MDLGIHDKVALVTGASEGIELGICQELASNGVHLIMVARTLTKLQYAANQLSQQYAIKTLVIAGDVSDIELPKQVITQAKKVFPNIDLLVNNAGRPHTGSVLSLAESD